jgi:hypothetical protein
MLLKNLLDNNLSGLANATESQLSQALEATMDHANGTLDSDNPFLNSVKSALNSVLTTANTISSATQLIFNTLLSAEASNIPRRVDPLTLDLDGDGVELINVTNSTAFFDLDVTADLDANGNPTGTYTSDGVKEQVGWVSSDDGLLTLDKNNNGAVDNILELFGRKRHSFDEVETMEERIAFLVSRGIRNEVIQAQARVVFEQSEKSDEALVRAYSIRNNEGFFETSSLGLIAVE